MSAEMSWRTVKGQEGEGMRPDDKNHYDAKEHVMHSKKDRSIPAAPNPLRKVFYPIYSSSRNIWPNCPFVGLA